ncbi:MULTISPECIES: acetyl/propionyl/methylcrotonyl-CoA carboxylase subunit alpha [unclassified Leifsonia]|uniref:acetyl/propionyl/methylcrotonyl-CoA carboxylase subunit alpha n=1 Tax=unclassified Leifsonia TaxID=2663824 RepID=UPI0003707057|nr:MULTISPECIES: biotin carboxylase N-terminal domain-containing protein [unclassified Leifsonia]TDP99613.1 acetyl-CoA/propionyl-CoA carboxylase, biotin carboxylase, biotin carboxyl carrier protein [Leifsonia sp. 115AMFTsu3.1]
MTSTPFRTVLVANRGEIACRVIRTLQRLGIRSVAVYSDADRDAPHVALADVAVRLGPPAARESYLDVDRIVDAARRTGAEAVHPGYGFLSENPALAEACEAAGIVFVGPGVHALEVMGDKITAKHAVAEHGVPTIPGIAEPGLGDDDLIAAAERIGFPVLVKPSAGGGGKGMQAVRSAGELPEALRAARRVAAAAFGDDTLFLERLVASPRHIEVQVLADRHGGIVHLGERECSLQRRHQKVVEEAPSPLLDEATRARIGEAACRVAESVGYVGAGTVEFLVSAEAPDEFFFMEMNTRLQVEHPVTELVTGLDLVEQQLRIAAGEPLSFAQEDVRLNGHAVEARVYAEDPERGFLPAAGHVLALREPAGDGVRVDSGIVAGIPIVTDYDPMLAKIVAWGEDRDQAFARLRGALAGTSILGAVSNLAWLVGLVSDDDVLAGRMDTTLIDRRFAEQTPAPVTEPELIAAALLAHRHRWQQPPTGVGAVWGAPTGWRPGRARPVRYDVDGVAVSVSGPVEDATVTVVRDAADTSAPDARRATLRLREPDAAGRPAVALLDLDGETIRFDIARDGDTVWLAREGRSRPLRLRDRATRLAERLAAVDRGTLAAHPELRSPMPGTVVAVPVETGARVAAGDTVVVVEAMKMEHRLVAPVDGVVAVHVGPGDLVRLDQLVARVDADEADDADAADATPPIPSTSNVPPQPADAAPTRPAAAQR